MKKKNIIKKESQHFITGQQETTGTLLNSEEVEKLMDTIDNPLVFAIIGTILYAGLRVSEISNLSIQDVSLDEGIIHIRMGKEKKERIVPINKCLHQILSEYEQIAAPNRNYYFATASSGYVTPQYIEKYLSKYCEKAGIQKPVSAHALRYFFARHACASSYLTF